MFSETEKGNRKFVRFYFDVLDQRDPFECWANDDDFSTKVNLEEFAATFDGPFLNSAA